MKKRLKRWPINQLKPVIIHKLSKKIFVMEPFIECYVLLDLKRKVTDQFSSETFKNSDPHSQNTVRENIRMRRSLKLWDLENKTNMWVSLISIPLFLLINVLVIKSLAKYKIFVNRTERYSQFFSQHSFYCSPC